jgi:hypothetical protein
VVWAITDVDATTAITLAIAAARKQTITAFASNLGQRHEADPLYRLGMKEW